MNLSLDTLKELLEEDKTFRQERQIRNEVHRYLPLATAIQDALRTYGIVSPIKGRWVRPMPDSLYRCPLSEPQTTLVQWDSLPRPIQTKVTPPSDRNEPVEVPLSYLVAQDETSLEQSQAQKRTLGGNLWTKLTEYTRGVAGTIRPFRPGGLDPNEHGTSSRQDKYLTEESTRRAQLVLEKGSKESWKDKTILTAPPGADFKVGLSWKDVYGEDNEDDSQEEQNEEIVTDTKSASSFGADLPQSGVAKISTSVFTTGFFDDDSLFGSSSESKEETTESEDEESLLSDEGERPQSYAEEAKELFRDSLQKETFDQEAQIDDEDVDALLVKLDFEDDLFMKKRVDDATINPLEIAKKHAEHQNDASRKSWAVTKLLPIQDFNSMIPNPARTFPFTLDEFQQQAIARLERSESVFVAAHTSAGKTVVAEYAVALAMQRGTRAIYTSPLKALSNDKFRDFSLKFGSENVGLITGDLQVNADNSACLIMTTEILRSMLYRGADLIRDIEFVIFDEVHYVNDTERGVVWEEVIIMLPSYVNLIFLSATTPNTIEFSDWIGRTKRRPVHVVTTNHRPVPLSFYLWAGSKLHLIMEGKSGFLEKGYYDAENALLPMKEKKTDAKSRSQAKPATGSKQMAWQAQGTKQNWVSLVRFLDREGLIPAVVFSFSKKKCVEIAYMLQSLDLNSAKERSTVQSFSAQTVSRLSRNDAELPQVRMICEMVQRGIGIHHGGLLPILKEMTEILFSKNLIKVLFATETFAMGVNMPARTVVFNSIRKHDGNQFRILEPGENTQMAGRAGRRGLDKVGTVIYCCFGETPPPLATLRHLLTGSSTILKSQFRLTYNMILNLLRVEEMSVESMIKRSFSEFATQRALTANEYPRLLAKGLRTLERLEKATGEEASLRVGLQDLSDYFLCAQRLLTVNKQVLDYLVETDQPSFESIFQPGRLLLVSGARTLRSVRSPAVVIRGTETKTHTQGNVTSTVSTVVCLFLLPPNFVDIDARTKSEPGTIGYIGTSKERFYMIENIVLENILLVTDLKKKVDVTCLLNDNAAGKGRLGPTLNISPDGGRGSDNPFAGMKALGQKSSTESPRKSIITKRDEEISRITEVLIEAERIELEGPGLKTLDFRGYLKRGEDVMRYRNACEEIDMLVHQLRSFDSHRHPNLEKYYASLERIEALRWKVNTLRHLLSNESLQLFPDYLQRKAVLRKLGYIDANEIVCVKGRVACEVNTCEELIVTEMVFEGLLNNLEPEEISAVLSALVYQEKSSDTELDGELPESIVKCCDQMKIIATNLGRLQKECGLNIDPSEYCDSCLKFGLVHVVHDWALGISFKDICSLTDVQEGSIVRCITRLDELCREVRNCARVVGNPTLYRKLEAASVAIKRDIVFAASLYVS